MIPIGNDTTIVVGAGAHATYGMPPGVRLTELIVKNADGYFHEWQNLTGISRTDPASTLGESLRLSRIPSIDLFLQFNPALRDFGKFCIAAALLGPEANSLLHMSSDPDDWIAWVCNSVSNRHRDVDDFCTNFPRIITFNYDRVLELILCARLRNTTELSLEDCWSQVDDMEILHVYGALNREPQFREHARRPTFGAIQASDVRAASHGIQIMEERDEQESDVTARALDLFGNARQILFLGFSYQPENLRRIGIHDMSEAWHRTLNKSTVAGTVYEMGDAEIGTVTQLLTRRTSRVSEHTGPLRTRRPDLAGPASQCLRFLRDWIPQ